MDLLNDDLSDGVNRCDFTQRLTKINRCSRLIFFGSGRGSPPGLHQGKLKIDLLDLQPIVREEKRVNCPY